MSSEDTVFKGVTSYNSIPNFNKKKIHSKKDIPVVVIWPRHGGGFGSLHSMRL